MGPELSKELLAMHSYGPIQPIWAISHQSPAAADDVTMGPQRAAKTRTTWVQIYNTELLSTHSHGPTGNKRAADKMITHCQRLLPVVCFLHPNPPQTTAHNLIPVHMGSSILDDVLAYIGERILIILLLPGDNSKHHIASLHNELWYLLIISSTSLAALWIASLLSSANSSPHIPESVKIAFQQFSDITNPGSYTASNRIELPKVGVQPSGATRFRFTEWWNIVEGGALREPFDVQDELVGGLLHTLEMEYGAELHAKVLEQLRELQQGFLDNEAHYRSLNTEFIMY
ncbi:hypothetical protein V8E53_004711 [Lactarius tabidus]